MRTNYNNIFKRRNIILLMEKRAGSFFVTTIMEKFSYEGLKYFWSVNI